MEVNACITTHKLDFLVAPWKNPFWKRFKVGTVHGLWNCTEKSYQILSIINEKPGNGHFEDTLQWFEFCCKRDGMSLCILEIWNKRFLKHLIRKRGFKKVITENQINVIKKF